MFHFIFFIIFLPLFLYIDYKAAVIDSSVLRDKRTARRWEEGGLGGRERYRISATPPTPHDFSGHQDVSSIIYRTTSVIENVLDYQIHKFITSSRLLKFIFLQYVVGCKFFSLHYWWMDGFTTDTGVVIALRIGMEQMRDHRRRPQPDTGTLLPKDIDELPKRHK